VTVRAGRFGPYVNHGKTNATLKKDMSPETITLEEAAALIDARAERGPAPHARPRKAKRPSPGTARHVKASSKRPGARAAAKRSTNNKPSRKSTQAAE